MPITHILVPFPLSLDAGLAVNLLRNCGQDEWPGITDTTPLLFWGNDMVQTPEGGWEAKGILPVNCGGGPLDHHPHGKFPGECAATLVATRLKMRHEPVWRQLFDYTVWDDLRERRYERSAPPEQERMFAIARAFKDFQSADLTATDEEQHELAEKALAWLDTYVRNSYLPTQERFWKPAGAAYKKADIRKMVEANGKTAYQVVIATVDCDQFPAFARSQGADLIIQRWSNGHTQISCARRLRDHMESLAIHVRWAEIHCRGWQDPRWTIPLPQQVRNLLSQEGNLEISGQKGVQQKVPWYYLVSKGSSSSYPMLLNGSKQYRNVKVVDPSKLSLDQLALVVERWLSHLDSKRR